jgi:hypothetical protein
MTGLLVTSAPAPYALLLIQKEGRQVARAGPRATDRLGVQLADCQVR